MRASAGLVIVSAACVSLHLRLVPLIKKKKKKKKKKKTTPPLHAVQTDAVTVALSRMHCSGHLAPERPDASTIVNIR